MTAERVCGGLDWGSAGFQCSVMEKGSVAVRSLPLMKGGGGAVIDR